MNKERFNELLIAMVLSESGISDLLFIPGRAPQMSCYGQLRSYTSDLITDPVTAELTAQLAEIGYAPADIKYLALSHFHWDHVGNANLFVGATWLTPKAERDTMFAGTPLREPSLPAIAH